MEARPPLVPPPAGLFAEAIQARRTAREVSIQEARRASEQQRGLLEVSQARDVLLTFARKHRDHLGAQNDLEEDFARLQVENPEIEQRGLRYTLASLLKGPIKWLAIFVIDLCLLAAVSLFLISLAHTFPNNRPPLWMIVVVPLAILGLEMALAAHLASYDEPERSGTPAGRRGRWAWRSMAGLLAVVVPTLGGAALLTSLKVGMFDFGGVNTLMLVGVMALAAVCHGAVIYGGTSALDAIVQIVYRPKLRSLRRRIRREAREAQAAQDGARDAALRFEERLGAYGAAYGPPPNFALIQARDIPLINEALGEAVVVAPVPAPAAAPAPHPPPPAQDFTGDGHAGAAPPAALVPPPRAEPDEASAEMDYLRQTLQAHVRDADGEIR